MSLSDVPTEQLREMALHAGQVAIHPDDRDPEGIYAEGENLWVTPFSRWHSLRCRLFGHRPEVFPLLDRDGEKVGEVEWCRRCTSPIDREYRELREQ